MIEPYVLSTSTFADPSHTLLLTTPRALYPENNKTEMPQNSINNQFIMARNSGNHQD